MALKKGNKSLTVTLNPWHQRKLKELCEIRNLNATQVIQRLLEAQVKK